YGRSRRLMAVPFDLRNLRISGIPAPVLDSVPTSSRTGSMSYALSRDGTITYVPGAGSDDMLWSIMNVDLSGKATDFFDLKKDFENVRYSPDGKHIGFAIEEEGVANIWIYYVDGGAINQLTFYTEGYLVWFAWSPDSKRLAYATTAEDSTNSIYVKRIDGSGTAQKLFTMSENAMIRVKDWSGDGDKISFERVAGGQRDIFVYSFQDGSAQPYLSTTALEAEPYFSPNGKWLLYRSEESGTSEIYVRPYLKDSGGVWRVSNGDGSEPAWSPGGNRIYYSRGIEMYSVDVTATDLFSKGNPKKIFEGRYFARSGRRWDVHPDGDRFIMISAPEAEERRIYVIQNFDEELKRLVPVGRD
ncbi:hypothetical protein MJD09_26240, partial [bacterium]|nr:hypothetical protein [bacterium]